MDHKLTAIERAFQIAKSGEADSMRDIRRLLKREGYRDAHIEGLSLSRQLRRLMRDAKASRAPNPAET
jgi:hypothetical protein